jgi:predicted nucleotidyltransferase
VEEIMENKILNKLSEIEREKNIDILFAVESGSRAWGFESPDSDYDIRFVYKHKKDWYLNLWEQKDTIEFMTDNDLLDGSGWEFRKALKLLAKSNASFLGWLFSPIVYRANNDFLNEIKGIAKNNFNPVSGFYHYHSMSKGFEETLDTDEMTLKSFFYAIRTALCANWVYKNETIPPVLFTELYPIIDTKFHSLLNDLIDLKSREIEKSNEPVDSALIQLVRDIVADNNSIKNDLINKKPNPEEFNTFFLKEIR